MKLPAIESNKNVIFYKNNKSLKKNILTIRDNMELTLLAIPAILSFFIFNYIPMFGVIIAFKSYTYDKGILGSKWVGFDNFKFFFSSQDAWRVTRNTVGYNAVFIVVGIFSAVVVALLLFELKSKLQVKVFQTAMILPRFLSWVIIGYISYIFLNPVSGLINQFLDFIGKSPVDWYTQKGYWPFILFVCHIWKHVGIDCILYYAALMGIDNELYEAAKIDGAGKLQQTWYISIPSIKPVIIILGVLAVGSIFRGDFGLFYTIPRDIGPLYPVTDVIDTYIYRGLRTGDMGVTAAIGLFQSVVGMFLLFITNAIVKKLSPENSLF